jgi:hypothetical protein
LWPKNANLFGSKTWSDALSAVSNMNVTEFCGYSDGWHLPTINELTSLVNYSKSGLATWLNNQKFNSVQAYGYWSSTSYAPNTNIAWFVNFNYGYVAASTKITTLYVWPVRRAQ